jgi:hypothetical protein
MKSTFLRTATSLWAAALVSAQFAGTAHAQSYPVYTVTSLPVSSITAFNDSGLVLGRGFVPCTGLCTQSDVPVLYDSRTGTTTALSSGGFGSFASPYQAINAKGQLAGSTSTWDATVGAWVRRVVVRQVDGTVTTLASPTLSATQINGLQARGFNNAGQIALEHSDGIDLQGPVCGNYQGWIGTGATAAGWKALGTSGNVLRLAGINAGGTAVGSAAPAATCGGAGGGFHAVAALSSGALVDLHGSLAGSFSRANGINDLGYAVGDFDTGARTLADTYNPQGVPVTRAGVWNTAVQVRIDMAAAGQSRLNAVNNRGEVVGTANATMAAGQPFNPTAGRAMLGNLATNWPLVDLNSLLANNTAGWTLQDAIAINAGGQIVARGATASGTSGFVLLTPVTAPADPYSVVPSAPARLAASQVAATSALLTWTNTARNATRLVVERCKGSSCNNYVAVATLPSDSVQYSNRGLTTRTSYRWRVRAGNAKGLSTASNVVSATTLR